MRGTRAVPLKLSSVDVTSDCTLDYTLLYILSRVITLYQARKELSKVNRLRKNVKALVTRLESAFKALQQQHARMQKFREANKPVDFDINNSDIRHYLNLVEPNRVARPFISEADFERTTEKREEINKTLPQQTKSKDEGLEL